MHADKILIFKCFEQSFAFTLKMRVELILAHARFQNRHARDPRESFGVFNALIDDPDFHITCRLERPFKDGFDPMPVHRATRVCSTPYYRRESQRATEDYVDGFGLGEVIGAMAHQEELDQKFKDLIIESPEFRQVMSKFVLLKREYDAAKEIEMSTGFFSRLFGSNRAVV